MLLARILSRHGHHVSVARDGRDALAAVEQQAFDVVLMDVEMPGMNGYQATSEIRRREAEKSVHATPLHTPIVALTGHAAEDSRQRCLAAGMDDQVSKPVRAKDLLAVIARLTDGARRTEPPVCQSTPDADTALTDRAGILDYFNSDPDLLREVAASVQVRLPRLLESLAEAVVANDSEAVGQTAHTIKGLVGFLVAGEAFAAAHRLETIARHDGLASAIDALAALERELQALLGALPALVAEAAAAPQPHAAE